jgi:hypothetical protein
VVEAVAAGRADEAGVRVNALEVVEIERADADVAAQVPAAADLHRRRAVGHGGRRREKIGAATAKTPARANVLKLPMTGSLRSRASHSGHAGVMPTKGIVSESR